MNPFVKSQRFAVSPGEQNSGGELSLIELLSQAECWERFIVVEAGIYYTKYYIVILYQLKK